MSDRALHLWHLAETAFGLPDDGIVSWSLELVHTEDGWRATAWRSDTTAVDSGLHSSPGYALRALAKKGAAA